RVVVNDGAAQRSVVNSLTVTFDAAVTIARGAFEVRGQDGRRIDIDVSSTVVDGKTVAVLAVTGKDLVAGSLAGGNYTRTIPADGIRDEAGRAVDADGDGVAGGARVGAYFRLFGDGDGDRDVDARDLDRFFSTLGKRQGDAGFLSFFDHD